MVSLLAFVGMIVVVLGGLFGAYVVGFYDGVKDAERLGDHRVTQNHPCSREQLHV